MSLYKSNRPWARYVMVVWAFLECLFFAGTLYGWSSLVFVFKDEGIYSDLCPATFKKDLQGSKTKLNGNLTSQVYKPDNSAETFKAQKDINLTKPVELDTNAAYVATNTTLDVQCDQGKKQDGMLSLCFTISSAIFCISCVVMGHVTYKLGTRNTRYISYTIFVAGALCLAFTSQSIPWLMFPGLSLIGIGGLPVFVSNNQVANLFQKGGSTVVGLLCGGYDMSAAVYLVIKLAYQNGFSRKNMFFVLIGVHLMTLVSTQKFLPKGFIHIAVPHLQVKQREVNSEPMSRDALVVQEEDAEVRRRLSIVDDQPLTNYLRQPLFITHNIWLCLLQLRFYYYIGNLNTYLNRILDDNTKKVSYFTDVCFYTMMGGLFTSFLVGIVYDGQKYIFKGGRTKLYRCLMPAVVPLTMASMFALVLSVLVLISSEATLYVSFIAMTLYRSFTYVMAAAFINEIFPSQFFAFLYGVTMIAAGVFSLLQYALFGWAESSESAPNQVDVFLLCVTVVTLGHPMYMWYCARNEEASLANK